MAFKPKKYLGIVDLANLQSKQLSGNQIVQTIKPVIDGIIAAVQSNTFDCTAFPFEKQLLSGLTGKWGLYLIVNCNKKRIYLGGAADLAQRKGDHWRNLTNPAREVKLASAIKKDLQSGQPKDFVFVPLLICETQQITGLSAISTLASTFNQEVSNFLDTFVEGPLLECYLQNLPNVFYNIKSVGPFMPGNKFGGSPNSGKPSEPISYKSTNNSSGPSGQQRYAWESVSAAAKSFGVDTKLIRTKRDSGKMSKLTIAEFNAFTGIKITNAEATTYFVDKPAEFNQLLTELFPTIAKRNASNGEP